MLTRRKYIPVCTPHYGVNEGWAEMSRPVLGQDRGYGGTGQQGRAGQGMVQ